MNPKYLSTEELIHYIESGVIEQIQAEDASKIIQYYEQRVEDLKQEAQSEFDVGYESGYNDCEVKYT